MAKNTAANMMAKPARKMTIRARFSVRKTSKKPSCWYQRTSVQTLAKKMKPTTIKATTINVGVSAPRRCWGLPGGTVLAGRDKLGTS